MAEVTDPMCCRRLCRGSAQGRRQQGSIRGRPGQRIRTQRVQQPDLLHRPRDHCGGGSWARATIRSQGIQGDGSTSAGTAYRPRRRAPAPAALDTIRTPRPPPSRPGRCRSATSVVVPVWSARVRRRPGGGRRPSRTPRGPDDRRRCWSTARGRSPCRGRAGSPAGVGRGPRRSTRRPGAAACPGGVPRSGRGADGVAARIEQYHEVVGCHGYSSRSTVGTAGLPLASPSSTPRTCRPGAAGGRGRVARLDRAMGG